MADAGPSAGQKAIASLAKKPSDVTRQGTQKLKFVPTLPARRKKDEVKQEASQPPVQPSDKGGNARSRGRGRVRGGEGRGTAPRPPPAEMTASGPFAMGPALAGTSARRSNPRPNFTPVVPQGPPKEPALNPNPSSFAAPTPKKDKQRETTLADVAQTPQDDSDDEIYSEPDDGVEIIDMENVRRLDWMAPEILHRERRDRRKGLKTDTEDPLPAAGSNHGGPFGGVDHSNALDLSESEDEEQFGDLIEDFAVQAGEEEGIQHARLYFFQFPEPFPTFVSTTPACSSKMDVDIPDHGPSTSKRKVTFAAGSKPDSTVDAEPLDDAPNVDGVIGHMEVYRSGAVKMRLGNGIVLNVTEATQLSFLQQAVHLDMEDKKLCVLGQINKRLVVSPDLDALLTCMEAADTAVTALDDTDLVKMDPM